MDPQLEWLQTIYPLVLIPSNESSHYSCEIGHWHVNLCPQPSVNHPNLWRYKIINDLELLETDVATGFKRAKAAAKVALYAWMAAYLESGREL
jgi:hypothetical protein